jgi:GntR family transcriptional regulator
MAIGQFSHRPLYLQLRDALAERIATGAWKPGAAISNEGDLAREFGVSPGTMRKALDLMEHDRLVTRRQGRGTFVNDQSSDELSLRYINIRGRDGQRLIGDVKSPEITKSAANKMECARLDLLTGDGVYRIRRVRLSDDEPFMLEEASVPATLFPGLEEMSASTHRIVCLAQKHGILLGRAEERISIGSASPDVAEALNVATGSPIAVLDRVVRAIDGRAIEWRIGWCQLVKNYYLAHMD